MVLFLEITIYSSLMVISILLKRVACLNYRSVISLIRVVIDDMPLYITRFSQ